jgi:hypothetical protein
MARRTSTRSTKKAQDYTQIGEPGRFRFIYGDNLVWQSQEGMQTELFLWSNDVDEILCGGLRGPGKTEALIAWMAEPVAEPRYRGIILRFSAEALKETIDRATTLYRQMGAQVKNRPPEFHFPSGAIVYTGHLKDDRSFEDYRGHEYQRIGIEEATQIKKKLLYLKLLGSSRSTVPGLKAKVLLTSNPDGPGNDWVKKRFIKVFSGGEQLQPKKSFRDPIEKRIRIFIPGRRDENKILLANDPNYYERFRGLPDDLYKAWVEGDWDAPASQFFPEFRPHGPLVGPRGAEPPEARHVIPAQTLPAWCHRWAGMDWGYSHHTAAYWGGRGPDKRVHVYRELLVRKVGSDMLGAEFAKRSIPDLEGLQDHHMSLYLSADAFSTRDRTKTIAEQIQFGIQTILGPQSAFLLDLNQEEKSLKLRDPDAALRSLLDRRGEMAGRVAITIRRCNPDRVAGWSYLRTLLRWEKIQDPIKPDLEHARSLIEGPNGFVKYHTYMDLFKTQQPEVLPGMVIYDCCPELIETIPKLISDPNNRNDVMKFEGDEEEIGDDPADAVRYLVMGFHDQENQAPFPVWMEQEIDKFVAGDEGDINLRIQVARQAQQRYQKDNYQDAVLTLPRECLALREKSCQTKPN